MKVACSKAGRDDWAALFSAGAIGALSDAELLARFARGRGDASAEAAFAALVDRHGPMVRGVCRRVTGDRHAADDAFQAVFLVLARKAHAVRLGADDSLGRWLYGVSLRVARRARAVARRRPGAASDLQDLDPIDPSSSLDPCERADLRAAIDAEIARLPTRYRTAVVLCDLEGLSQEQAARRLRCPVGTVQSRLHRARQRLRSGLTRRGLAPAVGGLAALLERTTRAEVPPRLAVETTAAAASLAAGGPLAGVVPATVAALTMQTLRRTLMIKALWVGLMMAALALSGTAAGVLVGGGEEEPRAPAHPAGAAKPAAREPEASIADRFAQIRAEYEARKDQAAEASMKEATAFGRWKVFNQTSPNEVDFARRMVDLAAMAPEDVAARDALIWVMFKPFMSDGGLYGLQFNRAADLLLRYHGGDPEVARLGLTFDNLLSRHRDAFLEGIYASAKGREAKGIARLSLAQYLESKALPARGARKVEGRRKIHFQTYDDDGQLVEKEVEQSDEEYAYKLHLRLCDPDAIRAEAERLYEEVIAEYGDVPYLTRHHRELEEVLRKMPPDVDDPRKQEERESIRRQLDRKRTLGEVAADRLDEMHNLAVGKPAPEIEGVDLHGKPLKLSDYRGKVVALVFWGSWCGPCMREIPRERALVERMTGRPFAMLGVNTDANPEAARQVMEAQGVTWPNWHDGEPGEGLIAKLYHIRGYPTVYVIDAEGTIRSKKAVGGPLDRLVEELVADREATGD